MNNVAPITKNSLRLLTILLKADATNQLTAIPISAISKKTNVSTVTVRNSIRSLMSHGYVDEGFTQRNARTYYVTKNGADMVHAILRDIKGGMRQWKYQIYYL